MKSLVESILSSTGIGAKAMKNKYKNAKISWTA